MKRLESALDFQQLSIKSVAKNGPVQPGAWDLGLFIFLAVWWLTCQQNFYSENSVSQLCRCTLHFVWSRTESSTLTQLPSCCVFFQQLLAFSLNYAWNLFWQFLAFTFFHIFSAGLFAACTSCSFHGCLTSFDINQPWYIWYICVWMYIGIY